MQVYYEIEYENYDDIEKTVRFAESGLENITPIVDSEKWERTEDIKKIEIGSYHANISFIKKGDESPAYMVMVIPLQNSVFDGDYIIKSIKDEINYNNLPF